jgi:hypothetical protein
MMEVTVIPGTRCHIRPGNPVGHPACPAVTASMLHRCRDNGIDAPLRFSQQG